MRPSRRRVVGAVARRLVPYLVEATIIPTALFYALLVVGDMRWALAGALAWSYGAIVRRAVVGLAIPGLLILATIGITVRTIVYLLSRNDFVYFVGPILRTTLTGLVLAASVAFGCPLIARFAGDFCPLAPDVSVRPRSGRPVHPADRPLGGCERAGGGVEPGTATDCPRRGLRRHGGRVRVDHHLHRRGADGRRLGHDRPSRGAGHRGVS